MIRAGRSHLLKSGLRGSGARPLTPQTRLANVRTAMYKRDGPDGSTSTLQWTPKTFAMIGGSVLAVWGTYSWMLAAPETVGKTGNETKGVPAAPISTKSNKP